MEFKEGDRVHVLRYADIDMEFYGTLAENDEFVNNFKIFNCSAYYFNGASLFKPCSSRFGPDKTDYYVLAEDEEDTETSEGQYTEETWRQVGKNLRSFADGFNNKCDSEQNTTDNVNHPDHYMLGEHEVKDIVSLVADKYHKGSVAHNVASALEYQMRAPNKNGLEDIKKARKCLDVAIENWE